MHKYKRGDVFVERGADGKAIGYRVILGNLNSKRYIACSIELDYDDDWLDDDVLDNWFEKCDHVETEFTNSLSPEACEGYMHVEGKRVLFERKHGIEHGEDS